MNTHSIRCGADGHVGVAFFVFCALLPRTFARRTSAIAASLAFAVPCIYAQTYETAFDDDGMVTVNGERTFILGLYAHSKHTETLDYQAIMLECAEAGFNLAHVRGRNADAPATAAAANGLMTWSNVGAPRSDEELPAFRRAVQRVATLPALAFVESVDEPAWTLRKVEQRVPPEAVIRGYTIIKDLISNRLVYTNHAPTNLVSTLQEYNPGTDIVAVDVYPVVPPGLVIPGLVFEDGLQGDLNNPYLSQVGEYVRKMRRVAGPGRPVFSVQQGFAWETLRTHSVRDETRIQYPTRDECRFMAYQAIIEGATGILYWGLHEMPKPSLHWDAVKSVVRELANLENVLSTRTVGLAPEILYHEVGHSVDDGLSVLFKDVDGARYALICNADRYPCRATLSGFGEWGRVTVLYESRDLELEQGTLTDDWTGFGVHVYRFER